MDMGALARLIVIDILVICVTAIVIGGSAPRWPTRWLQRDRGPLTLTRYDTVDRYRRLGVTWWVRVLPEGGSWLGGKSKSTLPGRDVESLQSYLVEVRRGEWVHWLMMFAWLPLVFFNPWWLTALFAVAVFCLNAVFLLVLRYNQLRLTALLHRMQR
jgi:glycosyl-4,4'-diaponeurosporenoate acyltransferase